MFHFPANQLVPPIQTIKYTINTNSHLLSLKKCLGDILQLLTVTLLHTNPFTNSPPSCTNLHQPSPTFAGLAKGSAQTLQLSMSVVPQIHADRRQVDQLSSYTTLFLFADWGVNCRQFIHFLWSYESYWDGLLLDLPTSKMDHIKNNCTLGFLLDHWIIGSHSGRFSGTSNVIHFCCWSSDHEPEELGKMSKSNQQVGFFNNFTHALLSEPMAVTWIRSP
jgi:hypothetical protein